MHILKSVTYIRLLMDMDKYSPLFYALTWHNEGASGSNNYLPLDLVKNFPSNTLLHLAAKDLKRDEVVRILKKALAFGIINIFALQGGNFFIINFVNPLEHLINKNLNSKFTNFYRF